MFRRSLLSLVALACIIAVSPFSGPALGAPQPKANDKGPSLDLTINGSLDENDPKDRVLMQPSKIHSMKLPKGKSVQIDMISTDFDSYLRIENSKGQQLAADDDSGGNLNARILFNVPADDTYNIIAITLNGQVGNYQLVVKPAADPKAVKAIKIKAPEAGKSTKVEEKIANDDPQDLKRNHPAKTFEIEFAAGDYLIDLTSKDFDSFLRVLDKAGNELAFDDDGGEGLNSRLVFTAPAAGTYRLVATTFNGGTGNFELEIKSQGPTKALKAKAPEAGKSVKIEDKLTNDDPKDGKRRNPAKIFEVELAANAYQFDLMSTDFDAYIRVLDSTGKELAFNDDGGEGLNSRLVFTPPAAGTYRIVATTFNGGTGEFTLAIENKK